MTFTEIASALSAEFSEKVTVVEPETGDPCVTVVPEALVDVCQFLRDDDRLYFDVLNCVSGVDYLEPDAKKAAKAGFEPHCEVVYHLCSLAQRHRLALKVELPRWKDDAAGQLPELPTVSHIWAAADWHEREVFDLSGVFFVGHPDLRRILLSDDWEGHPLRKDYEYPLEYHGIRCR